MINTNINELLERANKLLQEEVKEEFKCETVNYFMEEVEEVEEVKEEEVKEEVKGNEFKEVLEEKIKAIEGIEGIEAELIGNWIWITGDTITVKEELKKLDFKYAKNKKMWYFNPDKSYRKRSRKTYSKEEMESLHGYKKIK